MAGDLALASYHDLKGKMIMQVNMKKGNGKNSITSKQFNRGLIFQLIATGTCNTRIELSRRTGLAKTTVTNIVAEFMEKGIVKECEEELTEVCGRNPIILKVADQAPKIIGILVFRTNIQAVLCSLDMQVFRTETIEFGELTGDILIQNAFELVDRMMEEQMPIDRESLQQMARLVNANPRIDVQTLVQMQKLGIPITVENASQFENYMNDSQAITRELDALIEQFPQSLTGTEGTPVKTETMRQLGNELLQILTDGLEEVPQQIQSPEPDMAYNLDGLNYESVQTDTAETQMQTEAAPETATETVQEHPEILSQQEGQAAAEEKGVAGQQEAETMETVSGKTTYTGQMSQTPHTLGAVLSQEQLQHLNRMIGDILGKPQSAYNANSGTVEVLKDLQQLCKDPLPLEREHLGKLFSSREFQALVRDTAEQQWMAKPGDLKEGDYVGRLYERLNSQMEKIESALKNAGQEHTAFSQMAGEIHSNVEFMNQVNQMYTYAQIPLKMSGQHASGELFVYTNKKALAQGEKDLTAFLHLDLDHLGSTDVSVRMRGREVSTRFYLDNDTAYALLEKNYPVLEARLEKKGYHCKIDVVNEEKHVNFVDDFLKMDQPAATQLHRYSFDMRA